MSLDSNLQSAFTAVGTAIKSKISSSERGAVNGVATLDGAGKLTASQLPASAIGGMIYQGIWDASTNSPAIPTSTVNNKGHYYKVSVAGSTTIDTINEWKVGDWIVSNGSVWDKIDNTDQVSTVAGRTGAIVLGTSDITGLDTTLGTIVTANATTSTSGLMSGSDKTKLDGVATNANNYILPNTSTTVTGGVKLSSDTVQGTSANAITSTAGRTYGVQVDDTGKAVVNIPWVDTNTTYVVATTGANGLMSSTDKTKLDGIATGANNYTHPTSGATAGTYKSVTVDANGHITAGTNPTTIAGYNITDATPSSHVGATGSAHGNATTVVAGFMSNTDKTKLDGIAASANNYVLPTATASVLGGVKISATAQTVAANAVTATATKTYAVQLDASGNAVVNVPWVDTNTIYTHPTTDGNLHVPATSTTNNGKVLMAGATAGTLNWTTLEISNTTGLQTALDAKATTASVTTLSNNVGATDTNYVTVFNAALA